MRAVSNQQQMRFPSKGLALILVLCGLFVAYVFIHPGDHQTFTLGDNLLQALLEGVSVLLTLPLWWPGDRHKGSSTSPRLPDEAEMNPMQRWVPLLLGLGILSYVIGQAIWTYNEDIAHLPVLFPSWADAGYLGSYPFVLFAILFLPHRRLLARTRARVFLDSLIIMVGVVTFSWYFVLGPTILFGSDTWMGQIIGTAYPLATLVLIFCLLHLGSSLHGRALQPVVVLLSLALAIIVITDSVYDYQQLHNLYLTGGLLDVGWPLGYLLVGLSARAMRLSLAADIPSVTPTSVPASFPLSDRGQSPSLLQVWIPLLFVPAVLGLLVWTEYGGSDLTLELGVMLGVILLLGLMMVRQVIVTHETIRQNHLLHQAQQEVQARNEELHRANEQLEKQAQIEGAYERERRLNELKDQFIVNVSHELRTPLTQVYGYLDLLGTHHRELTRDDQEAFLGLARQGCEDLLQLITVVLEAAQAEEPTSYLQKEQVLVNEVIHEIVAQVEPQQEQEHPLHLEVAEELVVQADPQALRQVLRNLLSNAFKYAPAPSPVRIVATRGDPGAKGSDRHPPVCICVQDSGPGIAPDDLPLLFGRFVRLKRDLAGSVRGTGLGLYISKQLVEAMGGRIWVESAGIVGQGSRFCFTLPAWDQTRAEEDRDN